MSTWPPKWEDWPCIPEFNINPKEPSYMRSRPAMKEAIQKVKTLGFDAKTEDMLLSQLSLKNNSQIKWYDGDTDDRIKERLNRLLAVTNAPARQPWPGIAASSLMQPPSKRQRTEPLVIESGEKLCEGLQLAEPIVVAAGGYSGATRGTFAGREVLVKWADVGNAEDMRERLEAEATLLDDENTLKPLWNKGVPELIDSGFSTDRQIYFVIMAYIKGHHPQKRTPEKHLDAAVKVLRPLHMMGILHANLSPHNVIIDNEGKVFLVNWTQWRSHATVQQCEEDMEKLYKAFEKDYTGYPGGTDGLGRFARVVVEDDD